MMQARFSSLDFTRTLRSGQVIRLYFHLVGDEPRPAIHVTASVRHESYQQVPIDDPEGLPAGFMGGDENAG